MKNIYCILFFITLLLFSCEDITEFNKNIKSPEVVKSGSLFANASKEFARLMGQQSVNTTNLKLWSQHWTQTTYVDESNYNLIERNVNGYTYDELYSDILRDLRDGRKFLEIDNSKRVTPYTDKEKNLAYALFDAMEVLGFCYLVDLFGDVPYTAFMTDDITPAYDDAKTIYLSLLEKLSKASTTLSSNLTEANPLATSDLFYGGNNSLWLKAVNSLMLRLAIRISDVDPANGKKYAELAIAGGVISSSTEDMRFIFAQAPPNTHPLWEALVQSGRSDYIASNTLADVMNKYADPRRKGYFKNLGDKDNVIGAPHGLPSAYSKFSQPGKILENPSLTQVIIGYVEVEFLLAHAALLGYANAGDAATHYNQAITASIIEWGGTKANATTYLAQKGVTFDDAKARGLIGREKWTAMYSLPYEAYNTLRLYDVPMNKAEGAGTVPPTRWIYPKNEYDINRESLPKKNDPFDKIFWDIK